MATEAPRLPRPRGDWQKWGAIMNKFLRVAHNEDGTLKDPYVVGDITVSGTMKFKRILAGGVDS